MMTAAECLAKAAELDAMARNCPDEHDREGFARTARGWRSNAIVARHQEAWQALHGPVV